jgi:excisionase family DNA binding protein
MKLSKIGGEMVNGFQNHSDCDSNEGSHSGKLFENLDIGLLSIEEVAALLGKRPQTIRNLIAKRQLPFVRVGRKNFVRRESLETWLKRKEFKPWQ